MLRTDTTIAINFLKKIQRAAIFAARTYERACKMMLCYLLCYKWCSYFFNLLETTDLNKNVHKSYLLKFSRLLQPFIGLKITMNCFLNVLFLKKCPIKIFSHLHCFCWKCLNFLSLNKIKIINIYLSKCTKMKIIFHKIRLDYFLLFKD